MVQQSALTSPAARSVALLVAVFGAAILATPWVGWPLNFVLGTGTVIAIVRRQPELAPSSTWRARGRLSWRWLGAFVVATTIGLWGWRLVLDPDLSAARALLPDVALPLLLLGALAFATLNATFEELLFRGWLLDRLHALASPTAAVLLQGLAFGAIHWKGVPSGPAGFVLAGLWGTALGALRIHTRGLLTPWLAHVAADLIIVSLLIV